MYISRIHYDQQKLHGVHLETLRRNDPVRTEKKSTFHINVADHKMAIWRVVNKSLLTLFFIGLGPSFL